MLTLGEVYPLEEDADSELLVQIGWKADQYEFGFYEADVLSDGNRTSSWVEIAYSPHLGGAFVLWRSGVSALDAARSAVYGWVKGSSAASIPAGIMAKANAYGPPLDGYNFDSMEFYQLYPGEHASTPSTGCKST